MVSRVRIQNFKKLKDVEFFPQGINLLVGPNNSGKSSFCQALQFLSLSARFSIRDALTACFLEPWNITNVESPTDIVDFEIDADLRVSEKESISFIYELSVKCPRKVFSVQTTQQVANVISERLSATSEVSGFNKTVLFDNKDGQVTNLNENLFAMDPESNCTTNATAPTDKTMLSLLFDTKTNRAAISFRNYLIEWLYYNLQPFDLRGSKASPMERVLNVEGGNLSSVLFSLHNERPDVKRQLLKMTKKIEPDIEDIVFHVPNQSQVYMFYKNSRGNLFGGYQISDGTLLYMAISYVILNCRRKDEDHFAPLAIIEEPEHGIYVNLLKSLLEALDPSGEDGQFIFTSHNPYFIDLFDSELDGIHVFVPDGHTSRIVKPDKDKIMKYLEDFPLGEMHFRDMLV